MADFHIAAVCYMQAVLVETFVALCSPHRPCHNPGRMMRSNFFLHLGNAFFRKRRSPVTKATSKRSFLRRLRPSFPRLLGQVHEKAWRSYITGNAQLLQNVQLGGRIRHPGPAGMTGAAQVAQGFLKHQAGRRKLVIECVFWTASPGLKLPRNKKPPYSPQ